MVASLQFYPHSTSQHTVKIDVQSVCEMMFFVFSLRAQSCVCVSVSKCMCVCTKINKKKEQNKSERVVQKSVMDAFYLHAVYCTKISEKEEGNQE